MIKKIIIVFLFVSVVLMVQNCKNQKIECNPLQTKKIKIVNNIYYHYSGLKEVEINDLEEISAICTELNNNQLLVRDAVINYNTGFIEVLVDDDSLNSHLFSIIFSKIDGYLIHYNATDFKNEQLLKLILVNLKIDLDLVLAEESNIVKPHQ